MSIAGVIMDFKLDITTAIVAGVAAFGGALLTFFTANRDSVSRANEIAINSLLITINGLNQNAEQLRVRMTEMDRQLDALALENDALSLEVNRLRTLLYQTSCPAGVHYTEAGLELTNAS